MTMTLAAAETAAKQGEGRTSLEQRTCPVCGGALRALRARRWRCEKGHTVAYASGLSAGSKRVKSGWAEDASEGADLSPAAGVQQRTESHAKQVDIPRPTSEDIATSKAAWERKLKRNRQRRWRARQRAGLV
jgi:ribosomal protein S27AE